MAGSQDSRVISNQTRGNDVASKGKTLGTPADVVRTTVEGRFISLLQGCDRIVRKIGREFGSPKQLPTTEDIWPVILRDLGYTLSVSSILRAWPLSNEEPGSYEIREKEFVYRATWGKDDRKWRRKKKKRTVVTSPALDKVMFGEDGFYVSGKSTNGDLSSTLKMRDIIAARITRAPGTFLLVGSRSAVDVDEEVYDSYDCLAWKFLLRLLASSIKTGNLAYIIRGLEEAGQMIDRAVLTGNLETVRQSTALYMERWRELANRRQELV